MSSEGRVVFVNLNQTNSNQTISRTLLQSTIDPPTVVGEGLLWSKMRNVGKPEMRSPEAMCKPFMRDALAAGRYGAVVVLGS